MKKIGLFMGLYRNKLVSNIIMLILFSLLGAVLSCTILTQYNNQILCKEQLQQMSDALSINAGQAEQDFYFLFQTIENILGVLTFGAIFISV